MWCGHPRFVPRVSRSWRACTEACFIISSLVPFSKTDRLDLVQAKIHVLQSFILHAMLGRVRARATEGPVVEEMRACFSPCAGVAESCKACGSAMVAQAGSSCSFANPSHAMGQSQLLLLLQKVQKEASWIIC